MELDANNQKFINIIIDVSPDFPFTINPGEENETKYPSLMDMINPDDIPPITEMFSDISKGETEIFEAHCRFKVKGEYHWFFLSCKPVFGKFGKPVRFDGTMCDVTEYLETTGDDLVYKEYRRKHFSKLSELRKNAIILSEVLDAQYLTDIQKPLENTGIVSCMKNPDGSVISCVSGSTGKCDKQLSACAYTKKKTIRINHVESGSWHIGADSEELLEQYYPLWQTLCQTVSKMANAIVTVMNEMDNSQNANKMLSQNVEEQILLNNIYAIIMQTKTADETLESVLQLVGEYFKLDKIAIIQLENVNNENYSWVREGIETSDGYLSEKADPDDYPNIFADLQNVSASFSDSMTNDLAFGGVKSYAVFKLFDSGSFDGMIAFETITEERTWKQRERKQLRNIAQIVSSVLMRKKAQQKLEESQNRMRQLAFYDAIYNIPNRARLNKDLKSLLEKGTEGSIIAFKVTNTRNLSAVNGHTYSDMLLRSVAQYLKNLPIKSSKVYYFTNAIFMINLPECSSDISKQVAEMLIYRFSKPWAFEGEEVYINCSLGLAYYPVNGKTAEEICKAASVAMYRAREFKKNSYTLYSGNLERTRTFAATMEQHIKSSIDSGMKGFSIKFQPAFSAEDGRVVYCESLLRWSDEQYGSIPNSTLLPLAESLGLTSVIDSWVLQQSCLFAKKIQNSGFEDFKISVNLTASEIQMSTIVSQVKKALSDSGLDAGSLILEIPVKVKTSYDDSTHILTDLKALGVNVAIDSYGTEELSLKALKNSYINIINIPRMLLSQSDEFDKVLVNSIISLAHCKNIKICIKGIEDDLQLRTARSYPIDWVQGYYCSRPLTMEEAAKILMAKARAN